MLAAVLFGATDPANWRGRPHFVVDQQLRDLHNRDPRQPRAVSIAFADISRIREMCAGLLSKREKLEKRSFRCWQRIAFTRGSRWWAFQGVGALVTLAKIASDATRLSPARLVVRNGEFRHFEQSECEPPE